MGRTNYTTTTPTFVADPASVMQDNGGRQIDWSLVSDSFRSDSFYVQLNGAVAATDETMTVDALEQPVKAGTLLHFGEAGENVRVTTDAAAGATTLAIDPAPAAIEDNDRALVQGTANKSIPAGTAMAELASGKVIPRGSVTGAETASGLLVTAASENARSDALTGYGLYVGGVFYQNLLPGFGDAAWASTWRGELNSAGQFVWRTYQDSLAE